MITITRENDMRKLEKKGKWKIVEKDDERNKRGRTNKKKRKKKYRTNWTYKSNDDGKPASRPALTTTTNLD